MNRYILLVLGIYFTHLSFVLAQRVSPQELVFKVKTQGVVPDWLSEIAVVERTFPKHQAPKKDEKSRSGLPLVDLSRIYYAHLQEGANLEATLHRLRSDKRIVYAEPLRLAEPMYVPNDPGAATVSATPSNTNQYYLAKIKAYEAWDIQKGTPSSVIGIIDYGFRTTHEDLMDNLHSDYIDLGNNDYNLNLPHSYSYHGGAVAGIAAATPDNNKGITGVGFNCQYLPVKAINDALSSLNFGPSVVYLADRGVKVINMSFGYVGDPDEYWEDVVNYAVINKDVAMVAAAGNNGNTGRFWPASYKNVVSVGGTTASDSRWGGSNYNYEVDITAPSEYIHTTYYNCCAYGGVFNNNTSYIPAVSYNMSGTSFATPQVAAAIALLRTQYPDLDAFQAMARVIATSDDIDALNPSVAGLIGKGRLNVLRAVSEADVKAVRVENYQFLNNTYPIASQTANLAMDFKNLLSPTSNLNVTLSSLSPYVVVSANNINLGAMASNEIKNNTAAPFVLDIAPNTPYNTEIVLKITYQDGTFTTYEYLKIIINPDYAHLDINNITLHIGRKGKLAEYAYPYKKSLGYNNAGDYYTMAYAGGLLLATHTDSLVNSAPDYLGNFPTDFDTSGIYSFQITKNADYQEINARFKDSLSKRPKLEIHKKAYAFKNTPNENFAIVEYDITNDSTRIIPSLYTSVFTDFDIDNYAQNKADWDNTRKMGYAYNNANNLYAGIRLLTTETPNYYAFNNNGSSSSINLYDGFSKNEKFTAIANGLARTQAGMSGSGTDISLVVGGTMTNIQPQETRKIAFAYIAATNLADLQAISDTAQRVFIDKNTSPLPNIADELIVCYGDSLVLAPDNGIKFAFYDSFPLTTPVYVGSNLTLYGLQASQTWYIVCLDRFYPSPTKNVQITVAPLHETTIIATLSGKNEWLFEDYSNAVSSVWDFGDGNTGVGRYVRHTFNDGDYEVSLISTNVLGCRDTATYQISAVTDLDAILEKVKVYPNPAEKEIFVEGINNYTWEICNNWGIAILRGKDDKIIAINTLPQGLYFLKIYQNGQNKVFKISKR
ncbi:MAG: S8 family serine peptidase [Thermonemataceae bacterium]|nr:S8 family serine peptidase [Thermonemataceae bacterium]